MAWAAMKAFRLSPLAGLLLLLLLAQGAVQAQEGFSDSFHSSSLDATLWAANIQGIGSVEPQTDGLHMNLSPANDAAMFRLDVWSRCKVHGDFDAQVDYRLITWPPANGTRLGLGAWRTFAPPDFAGRWSEVGGPELYTALMADGAHATGTADTAGRLRLTRIGDILSAYFYSSGTWVLIHSHIDPQYAADANLSLSIWGHNSSPGVEAAWENFSVTAGALVCPGPFNPTYSMTGDEVAPGDPTPPPEDDKCPVSAPCKLLYAEDIPDGQPSGGFSVLAPAAIQQFAGDAIIPDGAIIGHVSYSRRSTVQLGTCPSTGTMVSSEWDFLEGTTDATTSTGSLSDLYSFSNWPAQLNDFRDSILTAYPGSVLHSRWVKPTTDSPSNVLVFKLADGSLLYLLAGEDPTLPPTQDCGPLTIRYVAFGVTADNPATPQDEGGIPLVTCAAAGAQTYTLRIDRDDTPWWEPVELDDTITCLPNTPEGSGVSVPLNGGTDVLAGIDVTFSTVTTGGATSVVTTTTGPPPPRGFEIVGLAELPLYFDINTDAFYSGDLTVCVRYDETQVEGPEPALRLMQRIDDNYVDVTTSVDTVGNVICGTTTHLSIFIVTQPLPAVGGTVELWPDASGPSIQPSDSRVPPYGALAGAAAGAVAFIAGAWYARRRFLR